MLWLPGTRERRSECKYGGEARLDSETLFGARAVGFIFGQILGTLVFQSSRVVSTQNGGPSLCQDDRNSPRAHPAPVLG